MATRPAVGLAYSPYLPQSKGLADTLASQIRGFADVVGVCSAWDRKDLGEVAAAGTIVVALGGDGTILRAARAAAPFGNSVVGVDFGRVGFLCELAPDRALESLRAIVDGAGWVEERMVLKAEVGIFAQAGDRIAATHLAVNDVVISRGAVCRPIDVAVRVDDIDLAVYRGDGVIVASPTGSTAYSMAAGGPVVWPQMDALLLTPIVTSFSGLPPIVLPRERSLILTQHSHHSVPMSADGDEDEDLEPGMGVRVTISDYKARFVRLGERDYFFRSLAAGLGRANGRGSDNAVQDHPA